MIHLVASGLLLNNIYGIGSRRVVIGRLQAVAGEIDFFWDHCSRHSGLM
jgi:hypothetical protein